MNEKEYIISKAGALLASQRFAVLSTYGDDQPYASLVAFVHDPTLEALFFATKQFTRKHKNLLDHPRVALLIQNSANSEADIQNAKVLTITGRAEPVGENEINGVMAQYLNKHPYLKGFTRSPDCILIKIRTNQLIWVENFETVLIMDMSS